MQALYMTAPAAKRKNTEVVLGKDGKPARKRNICALDCITIVGTHRAHVVCRAQMPS